MKTWIVHVVTDAGQQLRLTVWALDKALAMELALAEVPHGRVTCAYAD